MIGVVNFLASGTSIFTAKYFRRRTVFVWGHLAIGLAHMSIGFFAYVEYPNLVLVSMLLFVFFFQNSSGCITWLYCSEVAVDVVLGLVGFSAYFVIFILVLTTNFMMESETLHPWGTFWLFGSLSLAAALWFYLYVKETKHLNDKQKKSLYAVKDLDAEDNFIKKINDE